MTAITYSDSEQSLLLSTLSVSPAAVVTRFTDALIPSLPAVRVLESRTGLVMVPYSDTRQGTTFHLGETLVAEGRVKVADFEGYGACLGRDMKLALAIAILDAACLADLHRETILEFVNAQKTKQADSEEELLKKVESTRVEMETY